MLPDMAGDEEIWIPLVDEPIGSIVAQIQEENPEIEQLVDSPRRLLAFRTFAYIRVGLLLGELLVEQRRAAVRRHRDLGRAAARGAPSTTTRWPPRCARWPRRSPPTPTTRRESVGPSDAARERFATFAKQRLSADS